jgi:hypothetical protein
MTTIIRQRNKALYSTSYLIPVTVLCADFTKEELLLLQSGLHTLSQEYSKDEADSLYGFLEEAKKTFILEHPYDVADKTLSALSRSTVRYWDRFPFKITTGEFTLLLSGLAEQYIGERTEAYWSYTDIGRLMKVNSIRNVEDFRTFCIELLAQQSEIILSYLYGLGEITGRIALTTSTCKELNEKMTEYICPVSKSIFKEKKSKSGDSNLVLDKKELKDLFNTIIAGLEYSQRLNARRDVVRRSR